MYEEMQNYQEEEESGEEEEKEVAPTSAFEVTFSLDRIDEHQLVKLCQRHNRPKG